MKQYTAKQYTAKQYTAKQYTAKHSTRLDYKGFTTKILKSIFPSPTFTHTDIYTY